MILNLSADRDERLVNQQHQFGQASRNGKELEVTLIVEAGNDKRWNKRPRTIQTTKSTKRTQLAIAEAATDEFEAWGEFLSDIPDTRTLALRMYYTWSCQKTLHPVTPKQK